MWRIWILATAACLFLPAIAGEGSIALKRSPKPGDQLKYRVTLVFTVYGNDVFYTAEDTERVVSVEKDGTYSVESTQANMHANNGNDLLVQPNPNRVVSLYDKRGMVLDFQGEPSGQSWRDANLSCFVLPDKPVAKGDTWTVNVPAKLDREAPGATITYTYKGPEADKMGGVSVVRIEEKYAEVTQSTPATATGTIWVNPVDGTVVKLEEEWRNAPILGLSTVVNGHVAYERIP